MNIPPISGSTSAISQRPTLSEFAPSELQQTRTAQSSATPTQTQAAATQTAPGEFPREQLQDAVKQINDFPKPVNSAIQFSLDDDTGKTVIKIIDTASKEVLRQVPSEEMLAIAHALDKIAGVLIKQKA